MFALLGSHTGLAADDAAGVEDWLGEGGKELAAAGTHDALKFVRRRVYDVQCNWKVRVPFTVGVCMLAGSRQRIAISRVAAS